MRCKCECKCPENVEAYELLEDMPGLEAGAVFIHDKTDRENGSPAHGCLKLAWEKGMCQQAWCGHTFILPGQMVSEKKWFRKIRNGGVYK